ncbi:MAG: alpha/beta hydrolase [Nanoarchaeota archaeon]
MKRVFIIHGWDFNPKMNWYESVARTLEKEGFKVEIPEMPDTHSPVIREWVEKLVKIVGEVDEETYFICHSIGCKAVMKYLEGEVADGDVCGGVIFVGGWFSLSKEATPEPQMKLTAKPWLEMKTNFEKIKTRAKKFVAIFSDNDPYVPMNNVTLYQSNLDSEIIMLSGMGHFDEETASTKELPIVVELLKKMSK